MNQNDFCDHLETTQAERSTELASPLFLFAALPFFSDPAALSLLIFGLVVAVVTVGFMVYFLIAKGKSKA